MCHAYSKMRDWDERPYSPEEAKVPVYLGHPAGIGGCDDPVGFLIASHFEMVRQRALLKAKYPEIFREIAFELSDDRQRVEPMSRDLGERISRLVEGISADPNEPLGDEDLL